MAQRVYDFILDSLSYSIKVSHHHQKLGSVALKTHRKIVDALNSYDISLAREAIKQSVDVWQELQNKEDQVGRVHPAPTAHTTLDTVRYRAVQSNDITS
jgi:DNA-binding FadR family transcriptional regulator